MQLSDRKYYLPHGQKILSSPNRTNRSNRQFSTQVPEYREIFTSVANEMQMSYSKLYLSDRPKNSQSIRQIERIGQMNLVGNIGQPSYISSREVANPFLLLRCYFIILRRSLFFFQLTDPNRSFPRNSTIEWRSESLLEN